MTTRQWGQPAIGLGVPFLSCLALVPFRDSMANTNVALVLVLIIVGIAALGNRVTGAVAALSAATWFDFFLTQPYERFTILQRTDVETTTLLLLVGIAVTEIAHWGRRQQRRAGRESGYLAGLQLAAESVAGGTAPETMIEQVSGQLVGVLGATSCRFDRGTGLDHPRLEPDGRVIWGDLSWDIDGAGLPVQKETEIRAMCGGRFMGRFLITAAPDTHPPREMRTLAAALANLAGVALGADLAGREHPGRQDIPARA